MGESVKVTGAAYALGWFPQRSGILAAPWAGTTQGERVTH